MNISNIMELVHGVLSIDNVSKLTEEEFNNYNARLDENDGNFVDYHDFTEYCHGVGLDVNKFFVADNTMNPYWYIDSPAFVNIFILSKSCFEMLRFSGKSVLEMKKNLKKEWDEKNYEFFFTIFPGNFAFDYFIKHIMEIDKADVFKTFEDIYVKSEYGFNEIPKKCLEYIFSQPHDNHSDKIKTKENYVEIYRGQDTHSTPAQSAYSWTTNFQTALTFATRYTDMGEIYRAKIKKSDIVDYVYDRGESEVLVHPEKVYGIEKMDIIHPNEFEAIAAKKSKFDYIQIYSEWCQYQYELVGDLPDMRRDVHGAMHMKRVLLFSSMLALMEGLDKNDAELLAFCSITHDIGRTNDAEDAKHGQTSADLIVEEYGGYIPESCESENDTETALEIITSHSLDDNVGIKRIQENSAIVDKTKAIMLYRIFKDADALDRVRIHDLDYRYLRTVSAKKLPIFAQIALTQIK